MSRFALSLEERLDSVRAYHTAFYYLVDTKKELILEDWLQLQRWYRLAEAIAEPKRGVRAHINRGYEWYFYYDYVSPLKSMEKWERALEEGLREMAGRRLPDAASGPLQGTAGG